MAHKNQPPSTIPTLAEAAAQSGVVQILIRMDPVHGLQIQGPINDTVLCYGMLEAAKDAVRSFGAQQAMQKAQGGIVPVSAAQTKLRELRS